MDVKSWLRIQWDRFSAVVLVAIGALAVILGWRGVSGTPYPEEQLPYLVSAGVGGLFLLVLGGILWLSADLRDEWRKLDTLEEAIRTTLRPDDSEEAGPVPAQTSGATSNGAVPSARVESP